MNRLNARTYPRRALLPLLALIAAMLLAGGCGKEEKKEAARQPTEVTARTITPRDVPIASVFVAQTQSSQAVNIAARVSGFLDKRVYTEGAMVKARQVLFRMDPKPFQAQVDGAAAVLQRNQAALNVAKSNLARIKPLAQQNALSQKDLDDAQGQYEQAAAQIPQIDSQIAQTAQSLFPAELTLAAVRASVFASAANTYRAMGGGWVTAADKLTGNLLPAAAASPGLPPLF